MEKSPQLILVLGDQLTLGRGALRDARPGVDVLLLAEVCEEATYVPHNRHKIALIFSAMRHFAERAQAAGFTVIYRRYGDGVASLAQALDEALRAPRPHPFGGVRVTEPGEYRLRTVFDALATTVPVPLDVVEDNHFLASHREFSAWAKGRKQLRMEYFYREMRKRYGLLLDDEGGPEGGQWNFDRENRAGWRAKDSIPQRPDVTPDAITAQVLKEVEAAFPHNPGDLAQFRLAVTPADAQDQFAWFLQHALGNFGTYQDALAEESPWLFHSLVSMYINIGLLEPLAVCRAVEARFRDGECSLAAAEGFIRQVLGWREYVRGIYWLSMPAYGEHNALDAQRPLPEWFWSGDTPMRCLSQALRQSLDHGYAHHIQRLMVIGNFALLAGLEVSEVCAWYLAVYVDAFEWVELPNTLGMALHGDGGLMASKPYAASGKYLQRQGNHCAACAFDPKLTTGPRACPYNSLYWHFVDRHKGYLKSNARMGLIVGGWEKRNATDRQAIVAWADQLLEELV